MIFIPLVALAVLLVATLLRGWGVKRQSGKSAWAFTSATGMQRTAGACFALAFLPLGFGTVEIALGLGPQDWRLLFGAALSLSGCIIAIFAQIHLGNAWRVGVREGDTALFVESGLYRYSRNPIFVGMFVMAFGIALAASIWWVWVGMILLIASTSAQVRIEERHLENAFGGNYARFKARTPRWIGFPNDPPTQNRR